MRKTILTIFFLATGTFMYAQGYVPSRDDVMTFFTTKTLVVLEEIPFRSIIP